MHISLVVAVTDNNVIGFKGKRGFYSYGDMMFFKKLTMGAPVIMGRGTFESLKRPLKLKPNIILSHNQAYGPEGVIVAHSLEAAIEKAKSFNPEEVFIIGGQSVFDQAMDIADRIYMTRVHISVAGDRFFNYDLAGWRQVSKEAYAKDEKNDSSYDLITLER
jgi:dihydrofolate reductase